MAMRPRYIDEKGRVRLYSVKSWQTMRPSCQRLGARIAASLCVWAASSRRFRQVGVGKTSSSIHQMKSVWSEAACPIPVWKPPEPPTLSCVMTVRSFCASSHSPVPSVHPLLTTTISAIGHVWLRRASMVRFSNFSRLKVTTTAAMVSFPGFILWFLAS